MTGKKKNKTAAPEAPSLPQEDAREGDVPANDEASSSPESIVLEGATATDVAAELAESSELDGRDTLKLGEEEIDPREALGEFSDYDSLEDEYPEDKEPAADTRPGAEAETTGDLRATPKERRLQEMRLEAKIETLIFAANKPLKTAEITELLVDPTVTEDDVQRSLDDLIEFYDARNGGFRLHYLKRLGYQFQTADSAALMMERMFASRPRPISRAALETLAIIAYRQPVTRAEVEFIRGVDAGSIFKTLLERGLIKCTGRKEIIGRPMLFGTSDEFLKVFNLSSIKDLPPLEAFQPSREVMQGAMERLSDNAESGDLVDVEQYIADNAEAGADGATAEVTAEEAFDAADHHVDSDDPTATESDRDPLAASRDAATRQDLAHDISSESAGTDANPEVALPTGADLAPGGGELDR